MMDHSSNRRSGESLFAGAGETSNAMYAVFAAILVGVVLIAGAGFAGAEVLHNAAHDSRHAFAFPCH